MTDQPPERDWHFVLQCFDDDDVVSTLNLDHWQVTLFTKDYPVISIALSGNDLVAAREMEIFRERTIEDRPPGYAAGIKAERARIIAALREPPKELFNDPDRDWGWANGIKAFVSFADWWMANP